MALNLGVKLMIFLLCLSLAFTVLPRACSPAEVALGASGCIGYGTGIALATGVQSGTTFDLFTGWFGETGGINFWWATLLGTVAFGAAASIIFPNQYAIFAVIAGTFWTSFMLIPWSLVNSTSIISLPAPFGMFLAVIMVLMIAFCIITFLKGGDF